MPNRSVSLGGAAWALPLIMGLTPGVEAAEWKPGVPRVAYADLFEWSWSAVAKECTNFLGPKGFAAVKVSPPNEHRQGAEWWSRYRPVSYRLGSRSGDREQFRVMVETCKAAGVDVYVDAVINTMGKGIGQGSAGCYYDSTQFNYPCVPYARRDFRDICGTIYPGVAPGGAQCWSGDLGPTSPLPKLNTGSAYVQATLASYLTDLRALGVAGFLIDAAQAIPAAELKAILAKVPQPYFLTQDLVPDASFPASPEPYYELGRVSDFGFARGLRNAFLKRDGWHLARLPEALAAGSVAEAKATVFVNDHNTERSGCTAWGPGGVCESLNAFNGDAQRLANLFMLAYGHGYPQISSGFYFNGYDMGPPAQPYAGAETVPANCAAGFQVGKWDCVHRDPRVANMVGFANFTAGAAVEAWMAEGEDRIAFRRGSKGFFALNNSGAVWQKNFDTGLPDGQYCNVAAGGDMERCPAQARVTVSAGRAAVRVEPYAALALHVGVAAAQDLACDAPLPFRFEDRINAGLNRMAISDPVTIQGLQCRARISIAGGAYNVNGGEFTAGDGTVANGDVIRVRVEMPPALPPIPSAAARTATVKVGSVAAAFKAYASVSGEAYPCGSGVTCHAPAEPAVGRPVTVYYKGALAASAKLNLHVGFNGWTHKIHDLPMTKTSEGFWTVQFVVPDCVSEMNYVFNDGKNWDNNRRQDWRVQVGGAQANCRLAGA